MSAKWAKGWVLAPFLFLGVACGSSDPSTATLPTQTSNARTNPDNQEVQDTPSLSKNKTLTIASR